MNKKKDLLFSLLILHFIGFHQVSFGQRYFSNIELEASSNELAQISNVQARQDKYKIIISYDLNEPLTENQKIELNYTSYSGETFQNKISDAFGDVGEFVLPGTGKEIIIFLEGKHGKYILEKSLVRFGVMVIQ